MTEPYSSTMASLPSRRAEAGELVPGLPDSIVLDCVLPRVPWHTRVVLRVTSKAWMCALREPRTYGELSRRAHGMKPHKGVVIVHQLSEEATCECFMRMNTKRRMPRPHAISILEEGILGVAPQRIGRVRDMDQMEDIWTWKELPPIPALAPLRILHNCGIACVNGKIFVMGGWDPRTDAVSSDMYMLDIAAGLWKWEAMSRMNFPRAFFHCTASAGKIYIVGGTLAPHVEDPDPEVYNVDTNTWELLPRVNMSRGFHFNGLTLMKGGNLILAYGFCTTDRGELVSFRSAYDPKTGMWNEYKCEDDDVKDGIASSKFNDGGYGVVSKIDNGRDELASKFGDCALAAGQRRRTSGVVMSVMMV